MTTSPAPSRALIIRPSALGDVARSVPVLASLRAAYPDTRIDWVVRDDFAPVVENHPALNAVVPFQRKVIGRALTRGDIGPLLAFGRSLRAPGYDLVLDCQGLARSGLMTLWAGAGARVGHADARECAWLAYNRRVPCGPDAHTVARMLTLVEAIGVPAKSDAAAMRLYSSADARRWLALRPWAQRRYAVLAPTSAWRTKEWPPDRFAALARKLSVRGIVCVVTGGKGDRERLAALLDVPHANPLVHDLVGGTSIAQLMALIEGASLVVANDSAAAHIAVGFDRPLVALFGPTDPALAGPWGRDADVIRHAAGDYHYRDPRSGASMRRITVEEVLDAAGKRLW
ncbi:MAG TPA: glycosyltransferase family 9 protein [Phycisphaerales bacterium]|nr:glycosyltransferase family 9 protein [Phycisphaerales bacterium]